MDLDSRLSTYFTLRDLTVTDTGKSNVPNAVQIENLRRFAAVLDLLWVRVGPFNIISAFRSALVNDAVDGVSTSLHMQGEAGDIQPTTMSAKEYWGKILQDPTLRNALGEIALKQNTLHISLPTATKVGVPMIVEGTNYIRKSLDEALAFVGVHKTEVSIGIGILVLAAVAAFAFARGRK